MADSSIDLSQALGAFMEEARELLDQMEAILLRAEEAACDEEDLNALFRCAHTIKGSGGLFGLDEVVRFTHVVENVLDRLRKGSLQFDSALITLLLECQDHISNLIVAVAEHSEMPVARSDALIVELQGVLGQAPGGPAPGGPVATTPAPAQETAAEPERDEDGSAVMAADHWHLSLRFGEGVLQDGMDPLAFINYLNQYGKIAHIETITDQLPDFDGADPEICYLGFEVSLISSASKAEIEGVFEFVQDNSQILILPPQSRIAEFLNQIEALHGDVSRIGEILVACGSVTAKELEQALAEQRRAETPARIGEILVEQGAVPPTVVEAAVKKQIHAEERRNVESKSVKVPAERLDALIDRVGELVIAGVGTHAQIGRLDKPDLLESADLLLSLVEDIRDMALRLRMVAIGEVFSRFPRVVRDVSKELGKQIELRIHGAEAELDKSMVEKIGDPLMHLVRNSMDHGIESAEVRRARGKPEVGTVELNAYHESGSINIEVKDDGGGLDRERIFKKAVEQGLISPEAILSDQDVYRLILAPGFSTAEKITNLSGRGVGMDVVRSNIEALRGTLDIESVPGQSTTMRLCLPLTLAIIDGFHVGVGSSHFIIPLDMVVECIELPPDIGDSAYFEQRGEPLPFIRLRDVFGEEGPAHPRPRIIVVRFGSRRAGLVVDRIYGKCQTVIKPLGPLFAEVPAVSGSTIIGNGDVGMILDIPALIRHCSDIERSYLRLARPVAA
ncbi:chemotaxis protein CheA [Propionivibrio dicarboxylicus]|uniref:Chemotaxis protein CheA n=1 Tax=Propionivibrio dicarboxylicus TaxID=83767 RepID=A0A1G8KNK6_9RHOO|nr:chemotaxis protein CheA [Propionivibrio dicarboxylicus]SDI44959.1 two-component system, chemotaxis family, sensor kinase CheA [Propionivibrio dicarboxylicus]